MLAARISGSSTGKELLALNGTRPYYLCEVLVETTSRASRE